MIIRNRANCYWLVTSVDNQKIAYFFWATLCVWNIRSRCWFFNWRTRTYHTANHRLWSAILRTNIQLNKSIPELCVHRNKMSELYQTTTINIVRVVLVILPPSTGVLLLSFFYRAMLCISAHCVCLSVCPSVTRRYCVDMAKQVIYRVHRRLATSFQFYHTKCYDSILTGPPNGGVKCRRGA